MKYSELRGLALSRVLEEGTRCHQIDKVTAFDACLQGNVRYKFREPSVV
jgi:hypothetical protein